MEFLNAPSLSSNSEINLSEAASVASNLIGDKDGEAS